MNIMNDLKTLAEHTLAQDHNLSSCGEVGIQVYQSSGGSVLLDLDCGGQKDKPAIRMMEDPPGKFTIAVAPCDGKSLDCTNKRVFAMAEPLDALYQAFPYDHIRHIVDILLTH